MTRTSLLLALALATAACSDGTGPTSPPAALRASADRVTLGVGDTVRLEAARIEGAGGVRVATNAEWRSLDASRVTVDPTRGIVVARDTGDASLVVTAGDLADTVAVRVTRRVASLTLAIAADSMLAGGGTVATSVVARDANGVVIPDAAVLFESADTSLVRISRTGVVSGYEEGTATIRARAGLAMAEASVRVVWRRLDWRGFRPEFVSMGQSHGCALDAQGAAYCWGHSQFGRIGRSGLPTTFGATGVSIGAVETPERFVRLEAHDRASCGLTATNRLICWGANAIPRNAPTPVGVLDSIPSRAFAVGMHNQACAVSLEGVLRCWGHNDIYQLARGPLAGYDTLPAPAAGDVRFRDVKVGAFAGCGLDLEGKPWCWGEINWIHMRNNSLFDRPVATIDAPSLAQLEVFGTQSAACGLTSAGEAWCWGWNDYGQLGGGSDTSGTMRPVRVAGNRTFVRLDGGWEHMCGITPGGEVWCWGYPTGYGQFGYTKTTGPRRFAAGHVFRTFFVSWQGTCGIKESNETLCVGAVVAP